MINFNQPKYIIPLIVLPFIYVFLYLFQDAFGQEGKAAVLKATQSINPELPDPFLSDSDFMDKFDSFKEAHQHNKTESAIREIDRREVTQITQEMDSLQRKPVRPAIQAVKMMDATPQQPFVTKSTNSKPEEGDFDKEMKLFKAQMNYMDSLFNKTSDTTLSKQRLPDEASENSVAVDAPEEVTAAPKYVGKTNQHFAPQFNTITRRKKEVMMQAMLDEAVKVTVNSRIRLKLLEAVVVEGQVLPKGTYLYGLVSAFGNQRIEIAIRSILQDGELLPVELDIYDLDGLKGLYVPNASFRTFTREMGARLTSGQQLKTQPGSGKEMAYDLAMDAFNTTSRTLSRAMRKNKATLKYGTVVYLLNNHQKQ